MTDLAFDLAFAGSLEVDNEILYIFNQNKHKAEKNLNYLMRKDLKQEVDF